MAMPSKLFDWQVRYLDIYLFYVYGVYMCHFSQSKSKMSVTDTKLYAIWIAEIKFGVGPNCGLKLCGSVWSKNVWSQTIVSNCGLKMCGLKLLYQTVWSQTVVSALAKFGTLASEQSLAILHVLH